MLSGAAIVFDHRSSGFVGLAEKFHSQGPMKGNGKRIDRLGHRFQPGAAASLCFRDEMFVESGREALASLILADTNQMNVSGRGSLRDKAKQVSQHPPFFPDHIGGIAELVEIN